MSVLLLAMTAVLSGVEASVLDRDVWSSGYRHQRVFNSPRVNGSRVLEVLQVPRIESPHKEVLVSLPHEFADLLFDERKRVGGSLELSCYASANKNNGYVSGFRFNVTCLGENLFHYMSEIRRIFPENTLELCSKSLVESITDKSDPGLRAVLKYLRKQNGELVLDENRRAIFDDGIIVL